MLETDTPNNGVNMSIIQGELDAILHAELFVELICIFTKLYHRYLPVFIDF
jgi:hypothetical protein